MRYRRRKNRDPLICAALIGLILLWMWVCLTPYWEAVQPEASPAPLAVVQTAQPAVRIPAGTPAPEPAPTPIPGRYDGIAMTEAEREELAAVVWLEARGEPPEGQQAVAEVALNRALSGDFPDTVHEVLHQPGQFATAAYIGQAEPGEAQYAAIDRALSGESILPLDVVYFSTGGENDRVWGTIGNHVFCRGYVWE